MRQLWFVMTMLFLLAGCETTRVLQEPVALKDGVVTSKKAKVYSYAPADVLAQFESAATGPFRLAPGDKVSLRSLTRPELSSSQMIGPDGAISIPLVGEAKISLKTRAEAEQYINDALTKYYRYPSVQLMIEEYNSNKVIILGRVEKPGVIKFDTPPTLLEALARAGSLPVLDKQATLSRCAIFRGRDTIIWVDLKSILVGGDLRGNIRLKPDDLIYIPDSDDTLVYVLGEVNKPGAYRLTPDMSFLDALSQAGGPTRDADRDAITLFRGSKTVLQEVPFNQLVQSDPRLNVALEEGDVIYVPRSGLSKAGSFFQQIAPGLGLFFILFGGGN